MAFSTAAALIGAASLAVGLGTGITKSVAQGDLRGIGEKSGILSPKELPKLLEPIEQPKVMPTIDDAVNKARNNRLLQLQQRSGLSSTKFGG